MSSASRPGVLRVGYVPEHFSSPILQLAAQDPSIELVVQPAGTGQMIQSLGDGTIDVSVALTEALIAGIAKGNQSYRLVGSFVSTPLLWAIIVGARTRLSGALVTVDLGLMRKVMAYVLALREKWFEADGKTLAPLDFHIAAKDETFKSLRDDVNADTTAFFMWERQTTKPYADSSEVRFIGSIETPWPSWTIAASPNADKAAVTSFLDQLSGFARSFDSDESRSGAAVDYIESTHHYARQDIVDWLKTVRWQHDCRVVERSVITHTLDVLTTAGAIQAPSDGWQPDAFVDTEVAKLQ